MNGRAAARSGEWAQHFSNASCSVVSKIFQLLLIVACFSAIAQLFAKLENRLILLVSKSEKERERETKKQVYVNVAC